MKYVYMLILASVLAGCAGQDTAECYEVEGNATICEPGFKRPQREPREPRGGRFNRD